MLWARIDVANDGEETYVIRSKRPTRRLEAARHIGVRTVMANCSSRRVYLIKCQLVGIYRETAFEQCSIVHSSRNERPDLNSIELQTGVIC